MATMTRKRKPGSGRPKADKPTRDSVISFRVTDEFADWFDGLVEHCRRDVRWHSLPPPAVIVQALICLAKERGYDPEAPNT
jgi:hypothetical protein